VKASAQESIAKHFVGLKLLPKQANMVLAPFQAVNTSRRVRSSSWWPTWCSSPSRINSPTPWLFTTQLAAAVAFRPSPRTSWPTLKARSRPRWASSYTAKRPPRTSGSDRPCGSFWKGCWGPEQFLQLAHGRRIHWLAFCDERGSVVGMVRWLLLLVKLRRAAW